MKKLLMAIGVCVCMLAGAETLSFSGDLKEGVLVDAPAGAEQTFSCWFKVTGMGKGDKPYDRIIQAPRWYVHPVTAEDEVSGLTFGYTGASGKIVGCGVLPTPLFNVWQHLAVTFGKDGFHVYLNGKDANGGAAFADDRPAALTAGRACLGNAAPGGKRPFKGQIASAAFLPRALSAAEVAALVKTDPDGKPVTHPKSAMPTPADIIPVVDISHDAARQTVIAAGAPDRYEGHPTTLLADDGKTMFCVWTTGHGGPCGQMARSDNGGRTWKRIDDTLPGVYRRTHRNCPTLQKVVGPDGKVRYCVFSAKAKEGSGLAILMSEDLGTTWKEVPCAPHLSAGMPPTGFMQLKDGTCALFGQVRSDPKVKSDRPSDDQDVWMSVSKDGGFTWGPMRTVAHTPKRNLCEPFCLRSPDGKGLVLLMRENRHKGRSMMCFSYDEGATWSAPVDTPWALTGDRHEGVLLPDGRYVIAFRDQAVGSPARGQYTAWVGTWDDLVNGRPGQYRIHLLKHHGLGHRFPGSDWDTGYSGVELLPDGTIVCTTYSRHWPDDRQSSVVSTRFKIAETDCLLGAPKKQARAEILWTKTICAEPDRYIGWPTVCRLQNGDLLAVFSGDREEHVCPYGKVQLVRSTDGGETWSAPRTIANGLLDDRDAGIVQLPSGELIVTWFTSIAYASAWEVKRHPAYGRHHEKIPPELVKEGLGYYLMRSTDNGVTWSKREKLVHCEQTPHGPIVLKDGSLLQIGRRTADPDSAGKNLSTLRTIITVSRSTDAGRTWEVLCPEIPDRDGENARPHMFHEPHVAELADGMLVGMVRYHGDDDGKGLAKKGNGYMRQCFSKDGGRTWTPMEATPLLGLPPHLLPLPNGPLVCVYGRRLGDPGFGEFACLSDDGGKTWDVANEILLHPALNGDLGYPASTLLADGSILTVFYQQPMPGVKTCLMATKWRVTK